MRLYADDNADTFSIHDDWPTYGVQRGNDPKYIASSVWPTTRTSKRILNLSFADGHAVYFNFPENYSSADENIVSDPNYLWW